MENVLTIEQIWDALDAGKTVYWENGLYQVKPVKMKSHNQYSEVSKRDDEALRVTCTMNGFGSLITEGCLAKCFVK